ncbi:MAG: FHA domain-containing protein [Deltaproteobacteria bacterium]|jgi:pSer/pThr/pTyr-binding forkhead associated (FHA) protein|nr:FHA domain-containing protein [Deltaproteobacteria bacterium]
MPTLKLVFKNKTLENYPLQKGYPLTIGRKRNNDVIIENLAVSSHHAKIDSVGDGFVLIDLQSKNGSFVNGKLVDSHWLKPEDIISIGKHTLVFSYSEDEEQQDDGTEEIEKTMIMDTSDYRSMVTKSKDEAAQPPAKTKKPDTVAILRFVDGGSGKYKCRTSVIKIGRHPESDIVVKGFGIGRTAATISRRPDGFYLSYIGGMSRPKVNSKKVKDDKILHDNDIIQIGKTKLRFSERRPRKSREKKLEETQPIPQASPE